MNKFFTAFIVIYKINIKLSIIVSTIFILLLSMLFYINKNIDSNNYFVPKTLAYTEVQSSELNTILNSSKIEEQQYSFVTPLTKKSKVLLTINLPYENDFKIPIEQMKYIDGTNKVVLDNQNLLNNGEKIKNFPLVYLNIPPGASENGLNIRLEPYNIDNIITGQFPSTKEEVLIGETLANYYLNDYGLTNYQQLIGEQIPIKTRNCSNNCIDKTYEISGIYQTYNHNGYNNDENIFILPDDEYYYSKLNSYDKQGIFIYFDSKEEMENIINSSNNKWYTYKDYMFKNYKKIVNITFILFLNLLLFLLFFKEFILICKTLHVHNIRKFYYFTIFLSPFIILNIIYLILMQILN